MIIIGAILDLIIEHFHIYLTDESDNRSREWKKYKNTDKMRE